MYLKRICTIPGPSRTVGVTSIYAFLSAFLSSARWPVPLTPPRMCGQPRPAPYPLSRRGERRFGAGLGPGVSGPGLAPPEPSHRSDVALCSRTFPDSRRHLCLCFPLSISFLCAFLSSLGSALIYHRFPLQSRLERRSVLKRICAIPGPSRTVGFTSVYAFL